MTPAWILDIFAAVMLVVAAVSAARLVAARPWQRGAVVTDTDISHLLMAIAMAGMLAPSLTTLPDGAWEAVFAVLTAWFGYRVVRDYQRERCPGAGGRALRAAPGAQRGDALHVPRDDGRGRRLRNERHGRDVGRCGADAALSDPGVRLRAHPGRLQDLGPRPAVRQALQPARGERVAGRRRGGGRSRGGRRKPAVAAFSEAQAAAEFATVPARPGAALAEQAVSGDGTGNGSAPGRDSGASAWLLASGTTVGCRIAMGVTMALMLFIMI